MTFPTTSDRGQVLLDFYLEWKQIYDAQSWGVGRYFVKVNADGKRVRGGTEKGTISVSEVHGYGML